MKTLYQWLCRVEEAIATFGLCGCTVSLFIGAIARTLGYPIRYTYDIALFLFAWCIFLGADAALRRDRMVYVDVLIDNVSVRLRRGIRAASYCLMAAFLLLMSYNGVQLCIRSWRRPWPTMPSVSYGWVTMSVPVGCFLLFITTSIKFHQRIIKKTDVVMDYTSELGG